MEKVQWIKELVRSEQQLEESGIIEISRQLDSQRLLAFETLQFLLRLKTEIVDVTTAFNELKNSPVGKIKIYGIAKTHSDFMLFRDGYKMLFSIKSPGQISIRLNFLGTTFIPQPTPQAQSTKSQSSANPNLQNESMIQEYLIDYTWAPFHEVIWTYKGQPLKIEYLVKEIFSLFVQESSR